MPLEGAVRCLPVFFYDPQVRADSFYLVYLVHFVLFRSFRSPRSSSGLAPEIAGSQMTFFPAQSCRFNDSALQVGSSGL